MIFVGIDPGKHGAVAIIDQKGAIIDLDVMKDAVWFINYLRSFYEKNKETMVFIEKAQVMGPSNGIVSMFNYGVHFGELCGILYSIGIPHELVPPVTWTKVMHAGTVGDRPKIKSHMAVKRLFPNEDLKNPDAPRSVKDHEGIVDALLIAEYGRRKLMGTNI